MTGVVQLRAGAATDVGRVRTTNQDRHLLIAERGLYLVADGMGGAAGGEIASKLAIETIEGSYRHPSIEELVAAVEEANDRIHAQADDDPELRGMGTTVTAAALVDVEADEHQEGSDGDGDGGVRQQLVIANVGDSRAYLFRGGELTQLTEDHSMVADLVREGRLHPDDAEHHPQRNILTRVLGVYAEISVDLWPVDPVRGDRYVLCSDGLFNEVGPDQIAAVLRRYENDPDGSAGELVRLAVENGGHDNVTVVVIDVVDDGGVASKASAALAAAGDDMAGFTSARPATTTGDGAAPDLSRRERRRARRAERKEAHSKRTRLTWRVVVFVALLVALIGGAFYAIVWYGTSFYYVGFDGDEVVVYQGRPGGVLWIDPEIVEDGRTDIMRTDLPPPVLERVEAERVQSSLEDARTFVNRVEEDCCTPSATTTTAASTTTTAAARPAG